jgi:DNA polymerase III delta prime subunit
MTDGIKIPKKEVKGKSKGIKLPTRFLKETDDLYKKSKINYNLLNKSIPILLLGDIPGTGKTYTSLKLCSEKYEHTLVFMNTHELCIEWINTIEKDFGVYKINYPISRTYKLTEEHKSFLKYYFPDIKEDFNYMCKKCEDGDIRRSFILGYTPKNCCKGCEYRVKDGKIICPYKHYHKQLFKPYKKTELHKRMTFLVKTFIRTNIIDKMFKLSDKFDNIVFDENFIELLVDVKSFDNFSDIKKYITFYDNFIREYKGKEELKDIWEPIREILMFIKETEDYYGTRRKRILVDEMVSIKENNIKNSIVKLCNKFKLEELINWNEIINKLIIENPKWIKRITTNYFSKLLPILKDIYIIMKKREEKFKKIRESYTKEEKKIREEVEENIKKRINKYVIKEIEKKGYVNKNDLVYSYTILTRDIIINLMKIGKKIIINCSTLTKELINMLLPEYKDKFIFLKREDLTHKFNKIIIYKKGAYLKYTLYDGLSHKFSLQFNNLLEVLKGYIYNYRDKKILIVSFKVIERKLIKELERFCKEYDIKNIEFNHWYNLESTNKYEHIDILIQFGAPGISGRQMEILSNLLNVPIEQIKYYFISQQQYQVAERMRSRKSPNKKILIFLTNEVDIEEFKDNPIERRGEYIEYKYIEFLKKLSERTDSTIKECLDIYNSIEGYKKIKRDNISKKLNKLCRKSILIQSNIKPPSGKGRPLKVFNLPIRKKYS